MRTSLYDLKARYEAVFDLAIDSADDDGAIPQDFADALAAIEGQIEEKVEQTVFMWKSLEAFQRAAEIEAARLKRRAAAFEKNIDDIKQRLKDLLTEAGSTNYKCGTFTLSLCQNSQPSVKFDDESQVPAEFYIQRDPEISRTLIAEAIKGGREVPGAHLETGTHVRVR